MMPKNGIFAYLTENDSLRKETAMTQYSIIAGEWAPLVRKSGVIELAFCNAALSLLTSSPDCVFIFNTVNRSMRHIDATGRLSPGKQLNSVAPPGCWPGHRIALTPVAMLAALSGWRLVSMSI